MKYLSRLYLKGFAAIAIVMLLSCNQTVKKNINSDSLAINNEKYELDNGLDVILQSDTSNPIVSVYIQYHAGSINETPGKTGLAHYVEHMLFQRSENLDKGEFVKKLNGFGGWYNGGTGNDFTSYYEIFPNDALEKVLWMEADRMGYMISMVDAETVENEKTIILDEKRRNIVTSPYGFSYYSIVKNLYPENHPYNWEVIGETQDIKNIELADVKEFYEKYYHPGNATLVVAGDFDTEQTKQWIEKYFGEIKGNGDNEKLSVEPVVLNEDKVFYIEDNLVASPELQLVFPTVSGYHEDRYALDFLSTLIYEPINQILSESNLASQTNIYNWSRELAGTFQLQVRAAGNVDLDSLLNLVEQGFTRFENELFTETDLQRIKNNKEINFYRNNESVFQKATTLGTYNLFFDNPNYFLTELENEKKVSKKEVIRVYEKYIKNQKHLVSCLIPKDSIRLAVEGALEFKIPQEEKNLDYTLKDLPKNDHAFIKTPSKIDRSIEPEFGEIPVIQKPEIWSDTINGIKIKGIESSEMPLITFSFIIKGGHLADQNSKAGTADILDKLLMCGTKNSSASEIKEQINTFGASLDIKVYDEYIKLSASCMSKDYEQILSIIKEILFKPLFASCEFDKIKSQQANRILELQNNPNDVASSAFRKLMYDEKHVLGLPIIGNSKTIKNIELTDVNALYSKCFVADNVLFQIAGNISKDEIFNSIRDFSKDWIQREIEFPEIVFSTKHHTKIQRIDLPGVNKAVIFGGKTLSHENEDYTKAMFGHYRLGANTSSRLFSVLRNENHYTYDVLSHISRTTGNIFMTSQFDVPQNIVDEAFESFANIFKNYPTDYTLEDLETAKTSLMRKLHRKYETITNQLELLEEIAFYNLPHNYVETIINDIGNAEFEEIRQLLQKKFNEENMIYIIVADNNKIETSDFGVKLLN